MSEQDIINKYFSRHLPDNKSLIYSVGDDAAVVNPSHERYLVVSSDTLNIHQHFFADHPPEHLGKKSLAVNLSDIAAMGATPRWATLNLSLPGVDHAWLEKFSSGLYNLAERYNVKIIGGDLAKGPLSITIQIIGETNSNILLRSACEVDDLIYVTGNIGDAAFGLKLIKEKDISIAQQEREYFLAKLTKPEPCIKESKIIVKYSRAAIDISDGLLIDLKRMLNLSKKGAIVNIDKLPLSLAMKKHVPSIVKFEDILAGGEDYQLLFTIAADRKRELELEFQRSGLLITNIGKIIKGNHIQLMQKGKKIDLPSTEGFDHFA